MRTRPLLLLPLATLIMSCQGNAAWDEAERTLISEGYARLETADKACYDQTATHTDSTRALRSAPLRVLTIADPADSLFLRQKTRDLGPDAVGSEEYSRLEQLMIATVTSPEQDGVGIAGPQVGLGRRIVAVQRFDKEGEPFEVYPDIRIVATRGEKTTGREGCLSVPGKRGEVPRWRDIDISYLSPKSLKDTTERVQGFTAVIFQHECDHLDGVLYTDKATSLL